MIRARAEWLWRKVDRIRASRGAHGVVLIYHRVAEPAADPWNIAVSPRNFRAQMAMLRDLAAPRTLNGFADRIAGARAPERSIVVTFDDGYADNLAALEILEAHEVPATVFVVSGAVGKPRAFWWDLLTRIFLETPALPEELCVNVGGRRVRYDLAPAARYDTAALARAAAWRADFEAPGDARQRAYLDIWERLLPYPPEEIADAVTYLLDWAQLPDQGEGEGRPLTEAELARLAASPLIEIGGHTRTHVDLAQSSRSAARDEIGGGRRDLIEMTGQAVRSFAYPYGRMAPHTVAEIRDAGFSSAGCSRFGLASSRSDPFALPRVQVPDLPAAEFAALVTGVLGHG